jgi:hypothetical protein
MTYDPDYFCCQSCRIWFLKWDRGNILCPECFYEEYDLVEISGKLIWALKKEIYQDD